MRAMLCKEYGPPENLVLCELADPIPGPGEVVVVVRACAINFPDVLMIQDKYQFKPPMPFAPGADVAGVVAAIGPGVTGVAIGDRVTASAAFGGLAELRAVPANNLAPIPADMDFNAAAASLMVYSTSYYALKDRAHLKAGETMLVLGAAGGVGLTAVELGKHFGARVIAAASSEDKLALARDYGADATVLYPAGALDRDAQKALSDAFKAAAGATGVDVVYDPVGGDYAEPALRAMGWDGRYLVIGFAAGTIPRIPLNLPLLKGCQIVGVLLGARREREPDRHAANMRELQELLSSGALKPPVTAVYPFERAGEAIRALWDRRAKGKVVVAVSEG